MHVRLTLLTLGLFFATAGAADAFGQAAGRGEGRTYVIVHGAWGGGWAFKQVDSMMTARGHTVYRPTLTGLGERAHLADPEIGLRTHIQDVVNVLRYEELDDVALVGHSYGGMVVSGVAHRVPDRIDRLIYIDAFVPEDGESVMTITGDEPGEGLAEWVEDGFVVPVWAEADQPPPGDVPQSLKTFTEPVTLGNAAARRIPGAYILTVEAGAKGDAFSTHAGRAYERGWSVTRMTADHNPQWSAPEALVDLLVDVHVDRMPDPDSDVE